SKRLLTAAAGAAALALGSLLVVAPAASADEGGIHELPREEQLPSFPGFAPSFDTVTVVDAETGAVVGTRPNVAITGPKTTGPVAISGGPVTIVKVTLF
ncbi:hypothetical protein ACFVUP_37965, partial [Streptomyces bacillaris]|uniref:hypothetical protein n=1 Tax=Streptomyces bacillaris TaxID=68179 RepID=UPI0036DEB462